MDVHSNIEFKRAATTISRLDILTNGAIFLSGVLIAVSPFLLWYDTTAGSFTGFGPIHSQYSSMWQYHRVPSYGPFILVLAVCLIATALTTIGFPRLLPTRWLSLGISIAVLGISLFVIRKPKGVTTYKVFPNIAIFLLGGALLGIVSSLATLLLQPSRKPAIVGRVEPTSFEDERVGKRTRWVHYVGTVKKFLPVYLNEKVALYIIFFIITVASALAIVTTLTYGCGKPPPSQPHESTDVVDPGFGPDLVSFNSVEAFPGVFIENLSLQKVTPYLEKIIDHDYVERIKDLPEKAYIKLSGKLNSLLPKDKPVTVNLRVGIQTDKETTYLWSQWPRHSYGPQCETLPDQPVVDAWVDSVEAIVWEGMSIPYDLYDSSFPIATNDPEYPKWLPPTPLARWQESRGYRLEPDNQTEVYTFEIETGRTDRSGATTQYPPPGAPFVLNCYDTVMFKQEWRRDEQQLSTTFRRYTKNGSAITLNVTGTSNEGVVTYEVAHGPEGSLY